MNRFYAISASLLALIALTACTVTPNVPADKGGAQADKGGPPAQKAGTPAADPAEQAAIDVIKKNGGHVKQEGGRVVEVDLMTNIINDDALKELPSLKKVRKLRIYQGKITAAGIKHLAGLPELAELHLANCGIDSSCLKEIATLKQLKILALPGMKATGADLIALAPLTQLEELILSGNNSLGDAAGINIGAQFKQLKKLDIDNTDVQDAGLAAIAGLPELRYLSIHGNLKLTAKGFAALPQAKKLDELIIGFTFRDDSAKSIGACTNLRVLRLFHCEITDKGFKELANLNQLTQLEVRRGSVVNVSDAVVDDFKKAHPNCTVKKS